jgi:hypothetical protein
MMPENKFRDLYLDRCLGHIEFVLEIIKQYRDDDKEKKMTFTEWQAVVKETLEQANLAHMDRDELDQIMGRGEPRDEPFP